MQNLLDDAGYFKAPNGDLWRPRKLYKCFCRRCDADFYSANPQRHFCGHCSGPTATREVGA